MSKTKHTQGPWTVGEKIDDGWDSISIEPNICHVHDKNVIANARLIAAAPEMLEALQDIVSQIEAFEKIYGESAICPEAVIEAIKKAVGKQQLSNN